MPDKIVQDLPTSPNEARDSAMFAGKVGWTTLLVFLGLGLAAVLVSVVKGVPFVGGIVQSGEDMLRGKSQGDQNNPRASFNPFGGG